MTAQLYRSALVTLLILFMSSGAHADERVALVIGNGEYQKTIKLPNAAHDAATIGALFRVMAFDVVDARFDLDIADLRRVLRDFSDRVHDADIAVVYYAGLDSKLNGVASSSRQARRSSIASPTSPIAAEPSNSALVVTQTTSVICATICGFLWNARRL